MNKRRFEALFQNMERLRIGILGDFCLDVYWEADMLKSQLSRETSYYTLPVVRERISLGGAGNVAANIAAVFPVQLFAFGVSGKDWRESVQFDLLHKIHADTTGFVQDEERFTNAFIKPLRRGLTAELTEDARLDFEPQADLSAKSEQALLGRLRERMPELDVLCVCDQLTYGCVTTAVRDFLCSGQHKPAILADSRDRIGLYKNVIIKPNDIEACRTLDQPLGADTGRIRGIALALEERTGKPVIVTMGDNGCMVASGGEAAHVPAFPVPPPIDICGAGDTFLAVTACALAAGATLPEAAWLANAGASLTVRQLHTTGTATREQLYGMCTED
jgi:rfaE bifunctional protein kinase chain/domain